jgi:hypothetical protein
MNRIFPSQRVKINRTISNADGTLYTDSIVKVDEVIENNKVRVIDDVGKPWIVRLNDIEVIHD